MHFSKFRFDNNYAPKTIEHVAFPHHAMMCLSSIKSQCAKFMKILIVKIFSVLHGLLHGHYIEGITAAINS